jgi:hypothetical protein
MCSNFHTSLQNRWWWLEGIAPELRHRLCHPLWDGLILSGAEESRHGPQLLAESGTGRENEPTLAILEVKSVEAGDGKPWPVCLATLQPYHSSQAPAAG